MSKLHLFLVALILAPGLGDASASASEHHSLDLSESIIVSPYIAGEDPRAEAVRMLKGEIYKRSKIVIDILDQREFTPAPIIVVTEASDPGLDQAGYPRDEAVREFEKKPEGYRILVQTRTVPAPVVWVIGNDARGVLFGVGRLLREMILLPGEITLDVSFSDQSAPRYPLRGHQLGYRGKANTYDAWTPEVYEQHIRDLIVFGTNAIENIPFEDPHAAPQMPVSREQMNLELSKICARYGIEYWEWMPVMEHREEAEGAVALETEEERENLLKTWEEMFSKCERLDGIFVPSSDPGMNKASFMMPFLEKAAAALQRHHPEAKMWMSHQDFEGEDLDDMFDYLSKNQPDWFGGLVYGPWTKISLAESRQRLHPKYGIRSYPDITHTVRSQFPVHDWDPAYMQTVGREPINPRPVAMRDIHNRYAPHTIGVLTYSDGVNDDLNKILWSALAWDPDADLTEILSQYGDYFMKSGIGPKVAEGLYGLESNWVGPLATNPNVLGTLRLWQEMEEAEPELVETNWRFEQGLFRAYFDYYVRQRLLHETRIEEQVNAILANAKPRSRDLTTGSDSVVFDTGILLRTADLESAEPDIRRKLFYLGDLLYANIGMQLSVLRHGASDYDRGTMLDTVDIPLNNRRWIEDRFAEILKIEDEEERLAALKEIPLYERPKPGTLYDDLGHVGRQPHLVRIEGESLDPADRWTLKNEIQSWEPYLDRRRLSAQDGIGCFPRWSREWELNLFYPTVAQDRSYVFRAAIQKSEESEYALFADGVELKPMGPPASEAEIEEYAVPAELVEDGELSIQWKVARGRGIHVTETWLIPGD